MLLVGSVTTALHLETFLLIVIVLSVVRVFLYAYVIIIKLLHFHSVRDFVLITFVVYFDMTPDMMCGYVVCSLS